MTRKYESSHPWLTFALDLRNVSPRLWMLLGECESKCEHLADAPVRPEVMRRMLEVYFAKGVQGSAAIEGNSLSVEDVERAIDGTLQVPRSLEYQKQEVENLVAATNSISVDVLERGHRTLTVDHIRSFNRAVLKDLELEDYVTPGEIPDQLIGVGNIYAGAPREDCEYLLERLTEWMDNDTFASVLATSGVGPIGVAILRSILAHLYIAWIHPFGDGNGRTARLCEVFLLMAASAPMNATHLLSNHYNRTRAEYYRELDRASNPHDGDPRGTPLNFLTYALQGLRDFLVEQIEQVRESQVRDVWQCLVYDADLGKDGRAKERRRDVAIALLSHGPAKKREIRSLSPLITAHYVGMTDRTIARDLRELTQAGLVKPIDDSPTTTWAPVVGRVHRRRPPRATEQNPDARSED